MSAWRSLFGQPATTASRHTSWKGCSMDLAYSSSVQASVFWVLVLVLTSFLVACGEPMAQEEELAGWSLDDQGALPQEFFDESTACLNAAVEKFDDGVTSAETMGRIVAIRCFDYMQPLIESDYQGEELTRDVLEERAFLQGTAAVLSLRKNPPKPRNTRSAGLD